MKHKGRYFGQGDGDACGFVCSELWKNLKATMMVVSLLTIDLTDYKLSTFFFFWFLYSNKDAFVTIIDVCSIFFHQIVEFSIFRQKLIRNIKEIIILPLIFLNISKLSLQASSD